MQESTSDWSVNTDCTSPGQFEKFYNKHPREYEALFRNLNKIMGLLKSGQKIGGFHVGFFRSEGDGVYRIGQTGVEAAAESRLYVYPDSKSAVMHVLGVGEKDDQPRDVNDAKEIAGKIKKSTEKA